jgi:hypothetical protein
MRLVEASTLEQNHAKCDHIPIFPILRVDTIRDRVSGDHLREEEEIELSSEQMDVKTRL